MEVKTKSSVEEITITLTPRDFSSVKSLVDLNNRIGAILNDMTPAKVKAEYGEWCKQQIVQQLEKKVNDALFEAQEKDCKSDQNRKHGLYYNVIFDHVNWNQAQQLQTMAKKANIHFGKIERE
jgi:hypothetical protein